MIPIHLDPAALRIGLIGDGPLAARRLAWLRERGCEPSVWQSAPDDEALGALNVLWVADLTEEMSATIAQRARALKVIVNVEDVLPLCDFHTPAVVQRGQLTVSIGTAGASPAVAGAVRAIVQKALPEDWGDVLSDVADLRTRMRASGAAPREVIAASKDHLHNEQTAKRLAPCGRASCIVLTDPTLSQA